MGTTVDLVRQFRRSRVLVIGDVMLDSYLEGRARRLCSEGPVPVVHKVVERHAAGGAANTATNLRALGADVMVLSRVGQDSAGRTLRDVLRENDVDVRWLIEDLDFQTPHKMRILADGQYVVRFDEGAVAPSTTSTDAQSRLANYLDRAFARCDLVLISDYDYGVASQALIERLSELRAARHCVLVVDSKHPARFQRAGATVVTPNHLEARAAIGNQVDLLPVTGDVVADNAQIGRRLLEMIDARYAAITLASDGVVLVGRGGESVHLPAHPVPQASVVGAGDTFAAALALALAAGAGVVEAGQIAIDAAGIAVSRRGTAIVHHQELLQRVSLREHAVATRGQSQANRRQLAQDLARERLAGRTIVFTSGVFDILHAGHIELLTRAKALGDILVVGVNSDRSARRLKGKNRPVNHQNDRLSLVAALTPVDHAILFDEDDPGDLIRLLSPHIHVKGGDYADVTLPEAAAVEEVGGRIVILPLAGTLSTTTVMERIAALVATGGA